jgi:hypothetical protein
VTSPETVELAALVPVSAQPKSNAPEPVETPALLATKEWLTTRSVTLVVDAPVALPVKGWATAKSAVTVAIPAEEPTNVSVVASVALAVETPALLATSV